MKKCNANLLKSKKFRIRIVFSGFCICLLIIKCDCWTEGNGVVIDSMTSRPIDSVVAKSYVQKVKDNSYESEMITDSTGEFNGSTGNTGFCTDLVIELSKKGYKTITVTNPMDDTIKLIKE